MEKLKKVITQYGRWSVYSMYVERIEAHLVSDFSLCIENSKSLIEGVCKQICHEKSVAVAADVSFGKLVRAAFDAIGYGSGEYINVIAGSLSAIAHQLGNLRSAIGPTAHGKTVHELSARNDGLDDLSREFLMDAIEIVTCFLIKNFENENPRLVPIKEKDIPDYHQANDFNGYWDDMFGEFQMGDYAYTASEILFNVDFKAYVTEYNSFRETETPEE